jgi:hypothetical protein
VNIVQEFINLFLSLRGSLIFVMLIYLVLLVLVNFKFRLIYEQICFTIGYCDRASLLSINSYGFMPFRISPVPMDKLVVLPPCAEAGTKIELAK